MRLSARPATFTMTCSACWRVSPVTRLSTRAGSTGGLRVGDAERRRPTGSAAKIPPLRHSRTPWLPGGTIRTRASRWAAPTGTPARAVACCATGPGVRHPARLHNADADPAQSGFGNPVTRRSRRLRGRLRPGGPADVSLSRWGAGSDGRLRGRWDPEVSGERLHQCPRSKQYWS
jgi:hypothetical protein